LIFQIPNTKYVANYAKLYFKYLNNRGGNLSGPEEKLGFSIFVAKTICFASKFAAEMSLLTLLLD